MKTALLFSGQGAQYPGMMMDIINAYSEAREVLETAEDVLQRNLYAEISQLSQEELNETRNTQPCMVACELASLRVLHTIGVPYDAVAGFSLGEWAAVVAAGSVAEHAALHFIEHRADAMQRAVPIGEGGMAYLLGKDDESVEQICKEVGDVVPANYNIEGNVSVAGTAAGIDRFLKRGEAEGLLVGRIPVSIPSHCWLMQPAVDELTPLIQSLAMETPQKRLLMNATGSEAADVIQIKENLAMQLTHPVRFHQMVDNLLADGFDMFIEVGPGNTLSKMVKKAAKQQGYAVKVLQSGKLDDIESIKAVYGG